MQAQREGHRHASGERARPARPKTTGELIEPEIPEAEAGSPEIGQARKEGSQVHQRKRHQEERH